MPTTKANFNTDQVHGIPHDVENPAQIAKKLHQQYTADVGVFFTEIALLPIKKLCKILYELPSHIFEDRRAMLPHEMPGLLSP